jgi:hypothetical protein
VKYIGGNLFISIIVLVVASVCGRLCASMVKKIKIKTGFLIAFGIQIICVTTLVIRSNEMNSLGNDEGFWFTLLMMFGGFFGIAFGFVLSYGVNAMIFPSLFTQTAFATENIAAKIVSVFAP